MGVMGRRRVAAVLGAGNGGQGMATYLVRKGYTVRLWNRPDEQEEREWLAPIRQAGSLEVVGWGEGPAPIAAWYSSAIRYSRTLPRWTM